MAVFSVLLFCVQVVGYQYNPSQLGHIWLVTHLATGTPESIPQAYFNRLGVQMVVVVVLYTSSFVHHILYI